MNKISEIAIDKEETDMQDMFERGQNVAVCLIQYADENVTKMSATKLYESLLGVYDDYYNVCYGRGRKAWEKNLKNHILSIRKTCRIMLSYGIISRAQLPKYLFDDDPFMDNTVNFQRVESLVLALLYELKTFDTVAVFK